MPDTLLPNLPKAMMPITETAVPSRPSFPWKRFGADLIYATIFNIGVAVAITFLLSGGNFVGNMVASMCIGTTAFLFIDGMRLWLRRGSDQHSWPRLIIIIAVAVPLAQIVGGAMTELILGIRMRTLTEVYSERQAVGTMVFILLATIVATLLFSNRERLMRVEAEAAKEKARAEAIARQALQAQLQLLQAQIEPHMLFNTLANLQGLIAIDAPRAQHMLDQLIVYLRATLTSSRAEVTTLGQEMTLMDAYLGLMSVRMGNRLAYELHVPAELRGAQIPPMLLQPLIENAIIHGLEPKIEGGRIVVSAAALDGKLQVSVIDDGLGLDATSTKSGTQLGLSNTRSRLEAIHGSQAHLKLSPNPAGGARAELIVPLVMP